MSSFISLHVFIMSTYGVHIRCGNKGKVQYNVVMQAFNSRFRYLCAVFPSPLVLHLYLRVVAEVSLGEDNLVDFTNLFSWDEID